MRQLTLHLAAAIVALPALVQATTPSNAYCTSSGGDCTDVSACKGDGGVTVSNLCPASADNIKCCYYVTQDAIEKCSAKFGEQALGCLTTEYCGSQGGSSKAGFCPGSSDIQCCVLPAAKAPSTFTLPTGPPATPPGPKPTVGSTGHASMPTYTMSPGTATPPSDTYSTYSSAVSGAPSTYSNASVLSTTATLSPPTSASTSSSVATSTGGAWRVAESVRESWLVAPALLAGFAGLFL